MFKKKEKQNKNQEDKNKGSFGKKLSSSFVSDKEKYYLIENLSMLVASGMGIMSALESIEGGIKRKGTREIVSNIRNEVNNGVSLWIALEKSKLFSDYAISLIRMGEKSGRLSENLDLISSNYHKNRIFKSKLRSAMMYPILVFILSLVVGIGIAWFILPRLATVFSQLRLELPWVTRVLIKVGEFLGEYGSVFMPTLILVLFLAVFFTFFYKKTKRFGQYILMQIPLLREVIQEIELARAGFILGTLIEAGLSVVDAIESLAGITNFNIYKKFYIHLKEKVEEGKSFGEVFDEYSGMDKLVPRSIQQMIITGERSGRLSNTLLRVGENYESKMETTTKNLSILLEPILLIIVWVGVIFVALAVILPIYSLIGGLNQATNYSTPSIPAESESVTADEAFEESSEALQIEEINITESDLEESGVIDAADESSEAALEDGGVPDDIIGSLVVMDTGIGYLNVRSVGSLQGEIVGRVNPGDEYDFIEQDNDWYHVIVSVDEDGNRVTGWVINQYINVVSE